MVFICFGSVDRFSAEQIREVAAGLEASMQRFLWVVRAPPSDDKLEKPQEPDLDALLPEGFMARTGQGPRRQVLGAAAGRAGARVRGRLRDAPFVTP